MRRQGSGACGGYVMGRWRKDPNCFLGSEIKLGMISSGGAIGVARICWATCPSPAGKGSNRLSVYRANAFWAVLCAGCR